MSGPASVHNKTKGKRIARGVRMEQELWDFIEGQAKTFGESGASAVIARWAREKLKAFRRVA